jgi:hypothetical protein
MVTEFRDVTMKEQKEEKHVRAEGMAGPGKVGGTRQQGQVTDQLSGCRCDPPSHEENGRIGED